MAFESRITNTELNSRGATTLANQPKISATALKQEFDAPAKEIIAPKYNALIDELEATTAAESLGIVAPEGRGTSENIQGVVDKISLDLALLEGSFVEVAEQAHTHENKELLDTYSQTEEDLASAVSKKHDHSNKALLDTYNQTNADISSAVSQKHTHSNKALLDTYSQTEANLADAVSKKHSHSNKALLDTYTQTEANLASAVANTHTHSNKSLLDTYTQSNSNIADAVTKKHDHSNKTVLDKFGENASGKPTYNGDPIGGGSGTGDMSSDDYDPDSTVYNAGGIVAYVESQAPVEGNGIDITSRTISLDLDYLTASRLGFIDEDEKGATNGVATLVSGKVPSSQLPSYVDDVIEGYYKVADGKFYEDSSYTTEITGESGKIYVSLDTDKCYRWSGSAFVEVSPGATYTAGDGIDITNAVISVDEMPSSDMSDVVYPLPTTLQPITNPVGCIITMMGVDAPSGYLKCDGTVYNIADYQNLADFFADQFGTANNFGGDGSTTFAVPDLRGEFLRGTGTNSHSGNGNGAAVGVHQNGTTHRELYLVKRKDNSGRWLNITYSSTDYSSEDSTNYYYGNANTDYIGTKTLASYVAVTEESSSSSGGTFKSRPTNTSVLYCIKF